LSVFSGNILSNLIFYIAGKIGNFTISRFLFSTISFLFIYKGAKHYTGNVNVVLGLFMIAPFIIDATQVKSMVSMAVWFYFSYFLFEAYRNVDRKKNLVIYAVGVIIATLFHFSYALSLLYILVIYLNKKKIGIIALVVNIVGFTAFGLTRINALMDVIGNLMPNYQFILSRLRNGVLLFSDFNYTYRIRTMSIFYVILLILFVLLQRNSKMIDSLENSEKASIKTRELAEFVFRLNMVTLIVFPLMAISMELYRLQRDLLVVDYTFLSSLLFSRKKNGNHRFLIINVSNLKILSMGLIISIYYLYVEAIYGNINAVFLPVFHMIR